MTATLPFTVVGDVHGRLDTLQYAAVETLRAGLTTMLQVGDFWCYAGRDLDKADRMLTRLAKDQGHDPDDFQLYFCDGNHEDYTTLNPNAEGPIRLSKHITYVPRGTALNIHGHNVGFLGGAESIDRDPLLMGRDWWPEETMTFNQVNKALDMGPVDVLVTHDTTTAVYQELAARRTGPHVDRQVGQFERQAITAVIEHLEPDWLAHGHHHQWGVFQQGLTKVVALAPDGAPGTVATLDYEGNVAPLRGRFALRGTDPAHGLDTEPTAVAAEYPRR